MKVNWKKAIASTLVAAGLFVPSAAQAHDVPLGDPGFELYNTVPHGGFSYASPTPSLGYTGGYRPTSPWASNPGNAGGVPDGGSDESNWMYSTGYSVGTGKQPYPRSGNQAMHGRFQYSAQVSGELFEAGHTYTFSIWAQGDKGSIVFNPTPGWQSRVWLYIFDGSQPFEEATSLTYDRYSPTDGVNTGPSDFVNRDNSWNAAQSQAAWQQISISYTVAPGAPEIGNPVGVAFYAGSNNALDDATLSAVPEPTTVILVGAAGLTLLGVRRRS